MCVFAYIYMYANCFHTHTCGGQKKTLDALELELQEFVYSHVGTKPRSSA